MIAAWIAALAYAALIFALSSMSRPPMAAELQKVVSDFFLHVIEYGLFGALLARAFARSFVWWGALRWIAAAGAVAALYGISDEWHQSFVPGRSSSVSDAAADALGGLLGALTWVRLARPSRPSNR